MKASSMLHPNRSLSLNRSFGNPRISVHSPTVLDSPFHSTKTLYPGLFLNCSLSVAHLTLAGS